MGLFESLFSGDGFVPRTQCGNWSQGLIYQHILSDAATFLSYQIIPLLILRAIWSYRTTFKYTRQFLLIGGLFVAFIVLCGWTHFFDVLMFYHPLYRLNGLLRLLTAAVSLATVYALVALLPKAVRMTLQIGEQRRIVTQQTEWLRQILDAATDGKLVLHETSEEIDARLASPVSAEITMRCDTDESLGKVRRFVRSFAESAGFSSERAYDMMSSVHEAAMNALRHAGGGVVSCQVDGERLSVLVEDEGSGIPLDRLPLSTLKSGYSTAGTAGQGWHLVVHLTDEVHLFTGPTGTRLLMEMRLTKRDEPLMPPLPQMA